MIPMKRALFLGLVLLASCQSNPPAAPPPAPQQVAAAEPKGFMVGDVYFSRGRNSGRPIMTTRPGGGEPVSVFITESAYLRAAQYGEIPTSADDSPRPTLKAPETVNVNVRRIPTQ